MRKTLITAASLLGLMAGCAQPATAQSLDQWLENHRAQERATEAQHKATLASRQIFRLVPAGLQAKAAAYIKDTLKDPDSARFRFEAFFRLSILAYEELIQLVDLALAEAAEQTAREAEE